MKLAPFAALLLLAASVPALAQGQLPRGVVPVTYDIAIIPDAPARVFRGQETIAVDVRETTKSVTLNAADIDIKAATWDGRAVTTRLDKAAQQVTVMLPAAAQPGRHALGFTWNGKINESAAGLFSIDYTNGDGTKARMLATQFEAPDARRFAPMWDEPSFKARFKLSVVAPASQLAFSNMPAIAVTKNEDGTQLYRFGETPVMSSYLLFLGMGDLERKTVMAGKTEIGVITRRGVVDQGDYALAQAKRLLAYYNDYFGQPYPLPKMDMIAGPGSSQFFGAMENWGAIFYFENELLFDPKRTTESGRQRIFTVVAHEMAHQWFGDLVTMSWWDDLWLNEGFASWMEGKTADDLNPAWQAAAASVAGDREQALGIDATAATHPIIRHVETVDQIGQAFDGITYAKGQAVIDMLESTLGAVKFRDGIRRYMARYKYGNTVTDQLWSELSSVAGRPVATIAHDFTLQGGVPLVRVTGTRCVAGATVAILAQGRFGLDERSKAPQSWHVPLVVGTLGGADASAIVTGPATTVRVRGCGTMVVNQGKGSYARVLYDDATHAAIVRDYKRLALNDRLGTLGDDFALASGGYQDLSRWLALAARVDTGASPLEWASVASGMGRLQGLYAHTALEAPLRARVLKLLAPEMGRLGYQAKPGEPVLDTNLREQLLGMLGGNGDADVAAQARRYVALLATDPTAVPPAIRQPILSTFARNATPTEWEQLRALAQAEKSPVAKNRFVTLLGAARDETIARRALDLLTTDEITAPQKASLLRSIAGAHPDLAFDWAAGHHDLVDGFLEASTRAQFIVGLGAGSSDPAMPGKIMAYAEKYLPASSRDGAYRSVGIIAVRKATADRLRAATETWLNTAG